MKVDFGLGLLPGPPKNDTGQWAEALDLVLPQMAGHFRSLWMTDHFFWNDNPTYEAWTVMAFMAARWPQYEIGSMVLGQGYLNPALLAKMAATLQSLSGGRLVLGLGAGWKEDEYRAYNFSYPNPATRIEQLENTLEIVKRLWETPGKVNYEGKHYRVSDAFCEPKPEPLPPIMVGGGGRKTTLVAARHADWWNLSDARFDVYSDRVRLLQEHCLSIGRDPGSLRLTWFGRLAVGRTEADAKALGGRKWTVKNAFVGRPRQVVRQMKEFVELGVDYFMLEVLGLPDPSVLKRVLEEVLPEVK